MEVVVAFALAEAALVALKVQAQNILIEKWKRGELSLEQLKVLKTRHWFQQRFLKPVKSTSLSKKND